MTFLLYPEIICSTAGEIERKRLDSNYERNTKLYDSTLIIRYKEKEVATTYLLPFEEFLALGFTLFFFAFCFRCPCNLFSPVLQSSGSAPRAHPLIECFLQGTNSPFLSVSCLFPDPRISVHRHLLLLNVPCLLLLPFAVIMLIASLRSRPCHSQARLSCPL